MLTCALTVEPGRPTGATWTSSSSRSFGSDSAPTPTVCTGTPKLAISAIFAASKSGELSAPSLTSTTAAIPPDCAPRSTLNSASPMCVTGPGGGHLLERWQLDQIACEREQAHGERRLQIGQCARGQRVDGLLQARVRAVAVEHAARRVEQHGNRVLLRPQRLSHERRAPREHEQRRNQERLQHAERDELTGSKTRAPARERHSDRDGGRDDQRDQDPNGPAARKHEVGPLEGRTRVLEQQLEQTLAPLIRSQPYARRRSGLDDLVKTPDSSMSALREGEPRPVHLLSLPKRRRSRLDPAATVPASPKGALLSVDAATQGIVHSCLVPSSAR